MAEYRDPEITETWELCGGKCNDEPACSHWTWFKQNHREEDKRGKCILKQEKTFENSFVSAISGEKGCPTISVSGNNHSLTEQKIQSLYT